jgi:hypothetical protein
LLELHPGSFDDPLSGSLKTVSLDAARDQYEALSYVWGAPHADKQTISLETGTLVVWPNLEVVLRSIRSNTHNRTIWVDALCIDQANYNERTEQIQLMAEIYSYAHTVLAWLGTSTAHSALGMEVLSFLTGDEPFDTNAPWSRFTPDQIVQALNDILERVYFRRMWVVQETALGQLFRCAWEGRPSSGPMGSIRDTS